MLYEGKHPNLPWMLSGASALFLFACSTAHAGIQFDLRDSKPATFAFAVGAADLDADRLADIILSSDSLRVYWAGPSRGYDLVSSFASFSTPATPAVADMDADGHPDIIWGDRFYSLAAVVLNKGNRSFDAPAFFNSCGRPSCNPGFGATYVATARLDSDSTTDVVTIEGTNRGAGDGTLLPPAMIDNFPADLGNFGLADINDDGIVDIITPSACNCLAIYAGHGDATFGYLKSLSTTGTSVATAVSDLNHDGKLDILSMDDSGGVSILLGIGQATFQSEKRYLVATGSGTEYISVADITGDGTPDVVCASGADQVIYALVGRGDGSFEAPIAIAHVAPTSLAAVDLDHDGLADLLVSTSTSLLIFDNHSTATDVLPHAPPVDAEPAWLTRCEYTTYGLLLETSLQTGEIVAGEVYDTGGRRVLALQPTFLAVGRHVTVVPFARNANLSVGAYLCRLELNATESRRRILVLR